MEKLDKKEKTNKWKIFGISIIVLIILYIVANVLFVVVDVATKPKCNYEVQEWKGCDADPDCECTHKSWGGLGGCDTCRCYVCR